jgi:hypothetical protein
VSERLNVFERYAVPATVGEPQRRAVRLGDLRDRLLGAVRRFGRPRLRIFSAGRLRPSLAVMAPLVGGFIGVLTVVAMLIEGGTPSESGAGRQVDRLALVALPSEPVVAAQPRHHEAHGGDRSVRHAARASAGDGAQGRSLPRGNPESHQSESSGAPESSVSTWEPSPSAEPVDAASVDTAPQTTPVATATPTAAAPSPVQGDSPSDPDADEGGAAGEFGFER